MNAPEDVFNRKARLVKVVDGDTLRLEIDLGFGTALMHDVRLAGLDTPEPRGAEGHAGRFVTEKVNDWFHDRLSAPLRIQSKEFKVGKYGRCLCYVWKGEESLNAFLLDNGLAWPMNDRGQVMSRDVSTLAGIPDGIKSLVAANLA